MTQYIALVYDDVDLRKKHYLLNKNQLENWLKDESLKDGDEVYEVVLYGKIKRTTEILFEKS